MRNKIAFSDHVEQMKWKDFHFDVMPVNTLPQLERCTNAGEVLGLALHFFRA